MTDSDFTVNDWRRRLRGGTVSAAPATKMSPSTQIVLWPKQLSVGTICSFTVKMSYAWYSYRYCPISKWKDKFLSSFWILLLSCRAFKWQITRLAQPKQENTSSYIFYANNCLHFVHLFFIWIEFHSFFSSEYAVKLQRGSGVLHHWYSYNSLFAFVFLLVTCQMMGW